VRPGQRSSERKYGRASRQIVTRVAMKRFTGRLLS
jgi:hypothetical protein